MINATVAGSHRFGTVRKHGYDPAEVDAVVERLADALSASEERIHVLEQRLEESSVSSSAIARTLAAVEQTKEEIIAEAQSEADRIRHDAKSEAEEIAGLTASLDAELASRRDSILSEAYTYADQVMAAAHAEASHQEIRAAEMASDLIEDATRTAGALKVQSEAAARSQDIAAAWALRAVTDRANQMVMEAERQAALIVRDASYESQQLTEKAATIRTALQNLKASAQALADNTVSEVEVIDLAAVEAASKPFQPIQLVELEPDSEPEPDKVVVLDDEPTTYYQRRTATLRERIEIARSMP
jgi:DivIVA domain-containing protein